MHSDHFPDCFHRVTVKGLCVRDGKVLIEHQSEEKFSGSWELPGGGLDFGEDVKAGLMREIKEEIGLEVTKISSAPVYVWTSRHENNIRNIGWYYVLVLVYRVEFDSLDFITSEECDAIEFVSKEKLQSVNLSTQILPLRNIFNPDDFKGDF